MGTDDTIIQTRFSVMRVKTGKHARMKNLLSCVVWSEEVVLLSVKMVVVI